jgi:predicted glycosyltransferase involved in capsule biosynthesis
MDVSEEELIQNEKERNSIYLNSANQIKNRTLRRAQVLKDKRRKSKVCMIKSWYNLQIYMCLRRSRLIAVEFKSSFGF